MRSSPTVLDSLIAPEVDRRPAARTPTTRSRRTLRRVPAAVLAAVVLTTTACTAGPGATATPSASPTPLIETLCADPGITDCQVSADSILVTIDPALTDSAALALVPRLHAAAEENPPTYGATLQRPAPEVPVLDAEFANPPAWSLAVYPGKVSDAEATLSAMLLVAAVPGTLGVGVADGWPSVTVADIDRFADVFHAVSALPLFSDGGTYTLLSLDEHLRIVHTPRWVDTALIDEVIAIAARHPDAEVLLEAPTGGGTAPTLYIVHLTADTVAPLAAELSALPGPATEGVDVPYVLSTIGTDGVVYTNGVVGDSR